MSDKTYNGWSTYETWSANLWLDDAGIDVTVFSDGGLDDLLHAMVGSPETGLAADIFNDWIREVNLTEIIEAYAEDTQ
tara:strand:+ start:444 stop:677 length:234 start_codon:yes stop_codon:yes gene_type:complete